MEGATLAKRDHLVHPLAHHLMMMIDIDPEAGEGSVQLMRLIMLGPYNAQV